MILIFQLSSCHVNLCDENIHQHDEYGSVKVKIILTNEY